MSGIVKITYQGKEYEYPSGTSYGRIAEDLNDTEEKDVALVKANGKLRELWKTAKKDTQIELVKLNTPIGAETYRRSVTFMMVKAVYNVAGHENIKNVRILHSIGPGYYCECEGNVKVNQDFIDKVKEKMNFMVENKLEIHKETYDLTEAIDDFKKHGMYDKEKLFYFRNASYVHMYNMNGFEDYYYGYMLPNAGYLKYFEVYAYDEGFVLQFPEMNSPKVVPAFKPYDKLFKTLKETTKWGNMLGIRTVGDLNQCIIEDNVADLILVQEALQEKKIGDIAKEIFERKDVKFVLIAGPSSSSKTSFSHRLSIQLRTLGLVPHPIACDNYFVDRELTPRDEEGNYDFECLETMDIELLNKQLEDLLEGKEVDLPTYNFIKGKKEYLGDKLKLGDNDILVLEGIHCLNDKLTYKLDKKNKYKIYVSALTSLNVDEHNRIPTTDGRLIRRIVRDARTRGLGAKETIAMWASVRRGEEKHIFPFQETADVMFNSALIYELATLKQYCVPLLLAIKPTDPEYLEAKRLRKFFDYIVGIKDDVVPKNSLLKEFIGGSIFPVK